MTGRRSLLPWIVAFKAVKSILLTVLAATALSSLNTGPVEPLMRVTEATHLPVSSRLVARLLDIAWHTTRTKQMGVGIAALGYAVVMGVEGVGLYLRRGWARWLTIGVTCSFIPIEIYEIMERVNVVRVAILAINAMIVVYLWRRKEDFV